MEEKICPWCGLPLSEVGVVTPGMTANQFIDRYAPMWDNNFTPVLRSELQYYRREYEAGNICKQRLVLEGITTRQFVDRFIAMLHSGELVTERGASSVDNLPGDR